MLFRDPRVLSPDDAGKRLPLQIWNSHDNFNVTSAIVSLSHLPKHCAMSHSCLRKTIPSFVLLQLTLLALLQSSPFDAEDLRLQNTREFAL